MLDTSPAPFNSGEFDSSKFDFSRLSREVGLSTKKDELEERINAGGKVELKAVLAELYNHLRTQTTQYGAEGFNDTPLQLDLGRVRSRENPSPEAARLLADHMSPREFERLLQSVEASGTSEVEAFQGIAKLLLSQVYGIARMTNQAALVEREIEAGYFASVTNDELRGLAEFYGPRSPEAPELISEAVSRIAKLISEQDQLILGSTAQEQDLLPRERSARERIFEVASERGVDSLIAAVTILSDAENTMRTIQAVRENPDIRPAD